MSKLKFRAWDWKIMVYANGIWRWDFLVIDWGGRSIQNTKFGMLDPIVIISHESWELMQNTSQKDKNWKEIYEWDIIQNQIGEKWYILYDNFWCPCIMRDGEWDSISFPDLWFYGLFKKIKIIWNIYENPNLLDNPINDRKKFQ